MTVMVFGYLIGNSIDFFFQFTPPFSASFSFHGDNISTLKTVFDHISVWKWGRTRSSVFKLLRIDF